MNNTVRINSLSPRNEIEWTEEFTATTMSSAKAQATKWISRNLFTDEIEVNKDEVTDHYQVWTIR